MHIDNNAISSFKYGKDKETSDVFSIQKEGVLFFECKKRQFHNLDFIKNGDKKLYYERLNEFCFKPLKQICNRIEDFRNGEYELNGVSKDVYIYPIVISPVVFPLFSGAWDNYKLGEKILPDYYNEDGNVAEPEFIDFTELEYIEQYLKENKNLSFVDLIKIKRQDKEFHNANWLWILQKNGMVSQNKRLGSEYLGRITDFKKLLFNYN